jgi:succinate dehydrogenase / fumarate reductase membrane anchor subunit
MANNNIGPKRLVVGAHYGVRDWLAQRVTAVMMVAVHRRSC